MTNKDRQVKRAMLQGLLDTIDAEEANEQRDANIAKEERFSQILANFTICGATDGTNFVFRADKQSTEEVAMFGRMTVEAIYKSMNEQDRAIFLANSRVQLDNLEAELDDSTVS